MAKSKDAFKGFTLEALEFLSKLSMSSSTQRGSAWGSV